MLAIVFPGALGLDEASADLMIRAWSSMLGMCSREEGCADCATPVFWATVVAWTILAFGGSLALMPIVYKRFEVSVALRTAGGFLLQDSSRARASSSDAAAVETLTL